jgi:hypothetical protein
MRPTETRYLSAISGILLLAAVTACSPKTNNNVSQSPLSSAPAITATPTTSPKPTAPQTTTPAPTTTAETTPRSLEALDEPVVTIPKTASVPAPSNPRTETPANREPSRSSDTQDQRVNFGKGESSTVLNGAVVRAESKTYLVNAAKDQVMDLDISAVEDNAVVQVITPAGQVIGAEIKTMNKTLPETGDYQIIVSGTRGNATYKLNVAVK